MKITVHTIIIVFCSEDDTTQMSVLGSFIDENEARKCFEEHKQFELKLVRELSWEIYEDNENYLEVGEDGNFNNCFCMLKWYQEELEISKEEYFDEYDKEKIDYE